MEGNEQKVKKNIYEVTFVHPKDDRVSTMTVAAIGFDDALKKANENTAIVKSGDSDVVELAGIALVSALDVE